MTIDTLEFQVAAWTRFDDRAPASEQIALSTHGALLAKAVGEQSELKRSHFTILACARVVRFELAR